MVRHRLITFGLPRPTRQILIYNYAAPAPASAPQHWSKTDEDYVLPVLCLLSVTSCLRSFSLPTLIMITSCRSRWSLCTVKEIFL
jgi:hypothetical protein